MIEVKPKDPDWQNIERFIALEEKMFLERTVHIFSRYAGYIALVMCSLLMFLIVGALI